jgi:hypothetical protein
MDGCSDVVIEDAVVTRSESQASVEGDAGVGDDDGAPEASSRFGLRLEFLLDESGFDGGRFQLERVRVRAGEGVSLLRLRIPVVHGTVP